MRQIIAPILFCFCLGMSTVLPAQYLTGLTMNHDGESREYDLFIPAGYSPSQQPALVLNLHGLGSTSQSQASYTGFNTIADTAGFIVAYPQGLVRTIDIGRTGTHWNAYFGTNVDDLGFLNKLIDKLVNQYNIDQSRIYATGWSNGAYMAYRLACELNGKIAAVGTVAGTMIQEQVPNCNPSNAVSVVHIHGTEDTTVSYDGSSRSASVDAVISQWLTINNCLTGDRQETQMPDTNTTDNSTVTRVSYNTCTLNTDVELYRVNNGGHTWPGAIFDRPDLGETNRDIMASAIIWKFFKMHRNVNQVTDTEKDLSDQIFVYPAIFSENVTVNRLKEGALLSLYSYSGQLILQQTAQAPQETLLVSNLKPGVYVLHVQLPGNEYTSIRLVKSN